METIIARSTFEELRASLRGAAHIPGEEGYDEARKAWNLNAHQHPAPVVMAAGAADVIAAVRLARDEGLGVGVMATGHGFVSPCDGGVLINTSRMKGVRVDPEAQSARVEPGALWTDVIPGRLMVERTFSWLGQNRRMRLGTTRGIAPARRRS